MSNWFYLFSLLSAFILGARALERGVCRLGLPGILGHLLFGIILGALIGVPGDRVMEFLTYMGAIAFTFVLGMETDVDALLIGRREVSVAAVSLLVVLLPAFFTLSALGLGWRATLLTLAAISSTSISASVEDLVAMGLHRGRGWALHRTSAVLDEIAALTLIILALGSWPGILLNAGAFIALSLLLGHASERWLNRFLEEHPFPLRWMEGIMVGILMLFAALGDLFLGSAVEAAFILGLILGRGGIHDQFVERVEFSAYSFFVPVLTVYVGTLLIPGWSPGPTALAVLAAAVLGRPLATWIISRASGMAPGDSVLLGVADMPHLEIPLIALWIHVHAFGPKGDFTTSIILMAVVGTTLGVIALKLLQKRALILGTME